MNKKLLIYLLLISFSAWFHKSMAQSNNFQCTPVEFGFLPPPLPPCFTASGYSTGTVVVRSGDTYSATHDSISGTLSGCDPGFPLHDVWYSFIASGTHVEIQIDGLGYPPLTVLESAYVGLYESSTGECVGLVPRNCFLGSGTTSNMQFGPLTVGVKYYIQLASGSTLLGDGNFNIRINSKNICSDCSRNSLLEVEPLPVKASYPPETTVNFCYTVLGYNELHGNRFHGMVPLLGSGWDATTLTVLSTPDSVDLTGQWQWFSNINVGTSGIVSGYFYDQGGDNDPTNNLGDHGTVGSSWTFCFSVKTETIAACASGQTDLSIHFLNFADGESGSLVSSDNCSDDESYVFTAHTECCPKPDAIVTSSASCGTSDGSIQVINSASSLSGYAYDLYDASGSLIVSVGASASITFPALNAGNYYIDITNNDLLCHTFVNADIDNFITYNLHQTVYSCDTSCTNEAKIDVFTGISGPIVWTYSATGSVSGSGPSATNLCPGWHFVKLFDLLGSCSIVDSIFIRENPAAHPFFAYAQSQYCTADSIAELADFPGTGGGVFSVLSSTVAGIAFSNLNPSTGVLDLTSATSSGVVFIKYVTASPCVAVHYDSILVDISPPPPLASIFSDQQLCVGQAAVSYSNTSPYDVSWFSDSTLSTASYLTTQTSTSSYSYFSALPFTAPAIYTFFLANVNATNTCKSESILPVTITVSALPLVDAGTYSSVCPSFGISIIAQGADSYLWSPAAFLSNSTVQNPIVTIPSTTVFTVIGTNTATGCSATDTVTISVDSSATCNDIEVYNGFTPNGDGHNDFWFIDGIASDSKNQVSIFNRWGDKVWGVNGYNNQTNKWEGTSINGKILPDGTYFYIIQYKKETLKGYVELTR
jgi:gliding motility-associated-like protein